MPDTRIFYAVKANPAPEILSLLAGLGSCFDTASVPEIEMALNAGATPDRISFGNTIKKERDIARAHALGVSLFAVDSEEEVEKVARAAPGAKVFCRILTDGAGAEWPLSRKFGCEPAMAVGVLLRAHELGLKRLWHLLPRRLAADPARKPGIRPSAKPRRSSMPCRSTASCCRWSISAAASRPDTCARCRAPAAMPTPSTRR